MTPVDLPLAVLAIGFTLALGRVAWGPSPADRVIAAELAFVVLLAGLGLLAVRLESTHVLTVAVVVALLQFVTTAALAYLIQRTHTGEEDAE